MLLPVNFLYTQNAEKSDHEEKMESVSDDELSLRLSEIDEEETGHEDQGRRFTRNSRLNLEAQKFIDRGNGKEQTDV